MFTGVLLGYVLHLILDNSRTFTVPQDMRARGIDDGEEEEPYTGLSTPDYFLRRLTDMRIPFLLGLLRGLRRRRKW